MMSPKIRQIPPTGTNLTVLVGSPVAGGQCLARLDGQVIFVRGALPGETVRVRVTGSGRGGRFLRAVTVEVLEGSEHRVEPPCPVADRCGGCDWQHADLGYQRELKSAVVIDGLTRIGGIEAIDGKALTEAVTVEPVGSPNGLGWRTRMRFVTDTQGKLGLRAAGSHDVVAASHCHIAHPAIRAAVQTVDSWPAAVEVSAAVSSAGQVFVEGVTEPDYLDEQVEDRHWELSPDSFWQIHPDAATTLVRVVLAQTCPQPGDRVLDLYSGAGLFAAFLAERVGITGHVKAVEANPAAVEAAQRSLTDLTNIEYSTASVDRWLRRYRAGRTDVVVLDPPRSGACAEVVHRIADQAPRVVSYVACDPVALARDLRTFAERGYRLAELRAFDLFPMTKHVECVARIVPV